MSCFMSNLKQNNKPAYALWRQIEVVNVYKAQNNEWTENYNRRCASFGLTDLQNQNRDPGSVGQPKILGK